jgi:hypothetical protein
MPIFAIRDRASGWYLTIDGNRKGIHWRLVRELTFAFLVDAIDERDRNIQKALAMVQEYFGENKANGFELYIDKVAG